MKKNIFCSLLLLLFFTNSSFATCGVSDAFYTSAETYLSTCKSRPFDASKDSGVIAYCQLLLTQLTSAAQTLASDVVTSADSACSISDPSVKAAQIMQYKSRLSLNTQYGIEDPCQYKFPITQVIVPGSSEEQSPIEAFSSYMSIMYYGFCGM